MFSFEVRYFKAKQLQALFLLVLVKDPCDRLTRDAEKFRQLTDLSAAARIKYPFSKLYDSLNTICANELPAH